MMKITTLFTAALLAVSGATVSLDARAATDDDEAACVGKAQGEACTEADGDQGTCEPDSTTGVLECEDTTVDDDEAACVGKGQGDACTEADGDEGTCEPDAQTAVLECEDSVSNGCSASGTAGGDWLFGTVALAGVALYAGRRTRHSSAR